jgi:endonuclease YncB( thermonuclease family)
VVSIVWFGPSLPAHAGIVDVASVIDGNTLEIHGQRIRLHDIDAPEGSQTCLEDSAASGAAVSEPPWHCRTS